MQGRLRQGVLHNPVLLILKSSVRLEVHLVHFKEKSSGRGKSAVLPGELRKPPDPGPNCFTSGRKVNQGVRAKGSRPGVCQGSRCPAPAAADVPACTRTHTHRGQEAKWVCLPSLCATFEFCAQAVLLNQQPTPQNS